MPRIRPTSNYGFITTGVTANIATSTTCPSLQFTTAMTVAGWFKLNSAKSISNTRLLQKNDTTDYAILWESNAIAVYLNGVNRVTAVIQPVAWDRWNHIAVTYDNSLASQNVKVFINGVQVTQGNYTTAIATSVSAFKVGPDIGGSNPNWSSYHAVAYNRALIIPELQQLMFTDIAPTSGLQLEWKGVEGSGSTTADSSGNSYTGTLTGMNWIPSPFQPRIAVRDIPYSLNLAGTNQYGKATAVPFANATQVTILAWVKISPSNTSVNLLETSTLVTGANAFEVFQNHLGTGANPTNIGFYVNDVTNTKVSYCRTSNLAPFVWHRLTLVIDQTLSSSQAKIYVNGALDNAGYVTDQQCTSGIATNDLYFFARSTGTIPFKGGMIVNSIITGKAFSAAEVASEYQTSVLPSGGTLLANYAWNEGTGATIADTGTGAKNITLVNSPLWATDTPRKSRYKISTKTASLKLTATSSQKGTTAVGVNMSSATQLTVEGWFKINASTGTAQVLAGNTDATAANNGWEIEYDNAAVLAKTFLFLISRGASINYTRSSVLPMGVWHKVVCVYDGSLAASSRAKVYINGYLDSTNARADAVTGGFDSDILTLGDRRTAGFYPNSQNGMLRIYPGVAATPAQVLDNYYNDTLFGTPVARYEFNDGSGASVADSSGNGYNITLVNTPTWSSTDIPMKPRLQIPKQNLVLRSEEFDNASWTKSNLTVSANATTAPDGTTTADLVYPTTTGTFRSTYQAINSYKRRDYNTVSVYAKAAGLNYLTFVDFIIGSTGTVWFNLSNGTIGTSNAGYTGTIKDVGNGWYRCSVTAISSLTSVPFIQIIPCDADNSTTATTNGTNGVYLWGAQWNTVSQATDYQATTSAAVNTGAPRIQIT